MFDSLAKSMFEKIAGSAEEEGRAQEQLRPVLDGRFQPCLDLWKELWALADDLPKREEHEEAHLTDRDLDQLCERVDSFMRECGALISFPLLAALARFQVSLRKVDPKEGLLRDRDMVGLRKQLISSSEKDANGKDVQHPGLLMLLRDNIGSNARAASSMLR